MVISSVAILDVCHGEENDEDGGEEDDKDCGEEYDHDNGDEDLFALSSWASFASSTDFPSFSQPRHKDPFPEIKLCKRRNDNLMNCSINRQY